MLQYVVICGIPEITLDELLEKRYCERKCCYSRTEYDLEWWIKALAIEPVFDQSIATASGNVDKQFWCKL